MRALTLIFALCVLALPVHSQNAQSPHEGLCAELSTTPGNVSVRWWGKAGRTYFIQTSETLLPNSWSYLPTVEAGADAVLSLGMSAPSDKLFVRLVYTDAAFTGSVGDADADGDGLSNAMEVSLSIRSNPLVPDTDGDGFTDGVEHQYGYSPTLASSNPELVANTRYLDISRASFSARHVVAQPQQGVNFWTRTKTYFGMPGLTSVPTEQFDHKPSYPAIPPLPQFNSLSFGAWQAFNFADGNPVAYGENFYTNTSTVEEEDYAYNWSKMRVRAAAPSLRDRHYWLMLEKGPPGTSSDGREFRHVVLPAGAMEAVVNVEMAKLNDSIKEIAARSLMDWEVEGRGQRGDFVPSINGAAGEVHYVTPKWSQDIDGNNYKTVMVQARGLAHSDFAGSNAKYQWNCISEKTGLPAGAPDPTNASKFVINRETPDHFTLSVVPTTPTTGVVGKIHVWVVWADCTPTFKPAEWGIQKKVVGVLPGSPPLIPPVELTEDIGMKWFIRNELGHRHRFVFTIKPASICDQAVQERPDLEGSNQTDPPGRANDYAPDTRHKADHATKKWDVSRQMQVVVNNPNGFSGNDVPPSIPWPGEPAEGNDDPWGTDEDANPYSSKSGDDLDHSAQQMSSYDTPSFPVIDSWGYGLGNATYRVEANFREFCRLEINDGSRTTGAWFRISDYQQWHHYLSATWNGIEWSAAVGMSAGAGHPTP